MLSLLRVTDFILFGRVEIEFGEKLNVISGETGAGKSILLGAVEMLLGGEVSAGMIRTGAEKAVVEGLFYLDSGQRTALSGDGLLEEDPGEELVVRREITAASGRSRCFVNGALANLPLLRVLAERLIQVHGQQEHQFLTRGNHQLELLDAFAGLADQVDEFAGVLNRYRKLAGKIEALSIGLERGRRERELASFQLEEIEKAAISADEESSLDEELKILENAEKIGEIVLSLLTALEGDSNVGSSGEFSIAGELGVQRRGLESLTRFVDRAGPLLEQFDSARYTLEEVAGSLREIQARIEIDPNRLEEVRARLDEYYKLKKKYGPDVADVLARAVSLREELAGVERGEDELEKLKAEQLQLRDDLLAAAKRIGGRRRESAGEMERRVAARLDGLGMEGGRFEIGFKSVSDAAEPGGYLTTGNDRVTFLLHQPRRAADAPGRGCKRR